MVWNINSPLFDVDSYKDSHAALGAVHEWGQYPPNTTKQWSYIEARRGARFDETVFFGLQIWLKNLRPFTKEDVDEFVEFNKQHATPTGLEMNLRRILNEHGGHWPIEIRAVAEGTPVPVNNALAVITNTSEAGWWVPSWIETQAQRAVWYPSTVATLSREAKKIIKAALEKSADSTDGLPFKLHDFGARGATCREQSGLGGAAHLVNFMGTDTKMGIAYADAFYGGGMTGYSIPAMEHSSVTAWTETGECSAFRNMLYQFGDDSKILACVSDSFDLWRAIGKYWGTHLHEEVKKWGGTLVIRPDSGDPVETPVLACSLLMDQVGYTVNSKGFKVLPSYFRIIQGDGMNLDSIEALCAHAIERGISVDNFAFGMGGGLLQKVDRDTQRFAQKLSQIIVDGQAREVVKRPKTDPSKASKGGNLCLVRNHDGSYDTVQKWELLSPESDLLIPVWRNGELLVDHTFEEVRARAAV